MGFFSKTAKHAFKQKKKAAKHQKKRSKAEMAKIAAIDKRNRSIDWSKVKPRQVPRPHQGMTRFSSSQTIHRVQKTNNNSPTKKHNVKHVGGHKPVAGAKATAKHHKKQEEEKDEDMTKMALIGVAVVGAGAYFITRR